jgi:polyisoprenoid-binding protein YceI
LNRPALLALAAALAIAAAPAVAAAAPSAWSVDKAHSSLRFSTAMNGQAFSGAFRRWDADIRFDPRRLATCKVTISIDTTSAATGNADRDQALPTDSFFAAARFPRATFSADAFKSLGAGRYLAVGRLTLRGVSKPLTLPFSLAITGARASMSAAVALNRLAFGVGQDQWQATDVIPERVTVTIALTATRAR